MKTAFLVPGQGAQTVGMGADLYNHNNIYKKTFDVCAHGAGLDLAAACFDGQRMDEKRSCSTGDIRPFDVAFGRVE